MLKPIGKNYPCVFPTYGYVLLTVEGTTLMIMIIGILYYAKYRRAKAETTTNTKKGIPLQKTILRFPPYIA